MLGLCILVLWAGVCGGESGLDCLAGFASIGLCLHRGFVCRGCSAVLGIFVLVASSSVGARLRARTGWACCAGLAAFVCLGKMATLGWCGVVCAGLQCVIGAIWGRGVWGGLDGILVLCGVAMDLCMGGEIWVAMTWVGLLGCAWVWCELGLRASTGAWVRVSCPVRLRLALSSGCGLRLAWVRHHGEFGCLVSWAGLRPLPGLGISGAWGFGEGNADGRTGPRPLLAVPVVLALVLGPCTGGLAGFVSLAPVSFAE